MHLTVELPYARVPRALLYVRLQVMLGRYTRQRKQMISFVIPAHNERSVRGVTIHAPDFDASRKRA